MLVTFAFILFLILGSFLNVVIQRYPLMLARQWESVPTPAGEDSEFPITQAPSAPFNFFKPRSHCMSCCKQLKAWHLIPLLSYLLLRGRCAYCRSAISILYPVVECLTVATGLVAVWRFGISISAAWAVLFSSGLIVLAAIDLRCKILPDTLTLGLLWMGLLASIFDSHVTPSDSILAACLGYVFLWSIANLFRLFRKKEGMGQGDFKMFAMLGAWLGPTMLFNSLLIAVLLALSVSLTQLAMKKIARGTPIAFGPYLALGGWITFIFAPLLSQWFMPIVI